MRIVDNKPTISWVDVNRKQTPENHKGKIPPNIDWFISSLLANYKQYRLDPSTKSQLIYFIYLLLNKDFQRFLIRLRALFDVPKDGFVDINDFKSWEKSFNQSTNEFRTKGHTVIRFEKILKYYESNTGKRVQFLKTKARQEDPIEEIVHVLLSDFDIPYNFYFPWLIFMSSILFMPNPKHFLDSLARNPQEEKMKIEGSTITISITRETTLNSIRALLDKNKEKVNRAIQDVKDRVKETELEVEFLDRDYQAYKIYSNYSARDNKYSSERKVDKVNEKLRLPSKKYLGEDFNDGSIRKIASRMNQRIESTYSDRQRVFESVLDKIEQTS